MAFFGGRVMQFVLGGLVSSWAIAGCAGATYSMDQAMNKTMNKTMDQVMDGAAPVVSGAMDHGHGNSHSSGGHHPSGMGHGVLAIPPGQPIPQVTLTVKPDAMRGWNLHLRTTNFQFAPERVNQASLTTEGHAHLFINGEKTTRLYGPWYYIPALPQGEHELRVELNGNGHEILTVNGKPVEATVKVNVPAP